MCKTIMEDVTPIQALVFEEDFAIVVGKDDVATITPYVENGQMAPITWFEIRDSNGYILTRMNSMFVEFVSYVQMDVSEL